MRYLVGKKDLFSRAQGARATRTENRGYTLTFTANHAGSGTETFTVSFMHYLHVDNEGGQMVFREFTDNDEASLTFGQPVIGSQLVNA